MKYPVRCRITDPAGQPLDENYVAATPPISRPHVGKLGMAEKIPSTNFMGYDIRITLDDGTILMGYECWWEPVIPSVVV